MSGAFPRLPRRSVSRGFTLLEMLIALALGSVVFGAAMAAIVFLQKSLAATEQYAVNLADQSRLMDYLTLDLRRATDAACTTDGAGQVNGLVVSVPSYYADSNSTTPNPPRVYMERAYYSATPVTTALPAPITITYRQRSSFPDPRLGTLYDVVTRQEGTLPESTVAAGMDAFPQITFDSAAGSPTAAFSEALRARMKIVFRPHFQTPATPSSNTIVLHGLTFLRNNDVQQE